MAQPQSAGRMPRAFRISSYLPQVSLPGRANPDLVDQHLSPRRKRFRDTYGEGSDPKALYIAQPVWTRFSACFPRVAFLLDNLNWIYSVLDVTLVQFRNAYVLHGDAGPEGYRLVAPHIKNIDPFEYFSGYMNEDEQRSCLLHLRWALHRSRGSHFESLFRECANDILDSAKIQDRKMIVDELMSSELAEIIGSIPIDMDKGIWAVRRQISWREAMIDDALKRVRSALDTPAVASAPQRYYGPESLPSPIVNGFHDVEYGTDPIPTNGVREHTKREIRFSESPPGRSISPTWSRRGRRHGHRQRSISRDSYASTMHSILTEVPDEPDHFSLSMKVLSHATDEWHDIAAVMDTGCDAGNWISSRYLEDHLRMGEHIEEDPEADVIRVIDFGGKTDIKPRGRVKLLWYGKIVENGRQAKRSVKSEDWFRVAPHLPTESGKQPFDILLGKDWILEHEVFTFRGLRLFKSKDKRRKGMSSQEQAVLRQRELLREEAEMERLAERLASDAASISTGYSGSSPISGEPPGLSPRDSSRSIASSTAGSFDQSNGIGAAVDARAVA